MSPEHNEQDENWNPPPKTWDPSKPTEWLCFHCGELFDNAKDAAIHFGVKPSATPGCLLKLGKYDRHNLAAYRAKENQYNDLREFVLEAFGRILQIAETLPNYQGDRVSKEIEELLHLDIQVLRGTAPKPDIPEYFERKSKRDLFKMIENMIMHGVRGSIPRDMYFTAMTGLHHVWADAKMHAVGDLLRKQAEKIRGLSLQMKQMSRSYLRRLDKEISTSRRESERRFALETKLREALRVYDIELDWKGDPIPPVVNEDVETPKSG